jgi:hypothetical protein
MREGVRVRIGCEGDPCGTFRAADAPVGTVESVRRDGSKLHFELRMPDETVRKMNNFSIDPGDCWEIDPDYVETFRGHVEEDLRGQEEDLPRRDWDDESELLRDLAKRGETRKSEEEVDAATPSQDLGTMRDQLEELEARFRRAEKEQREFRETMASTVRHIAGDVFRSSKGEVIEFSPAYIDRFDVTQGGRSSPSTAFRRGASSHGEDRQFHDDRHEFQGDRRDHEARDDEARVDRHAFRDDRHDNEARDDRHDNEARDDRHDHAARDDRHDHAFRDDRHDHEARDDRHDRHGIYSRLDDYRSSSTRKKRKASHEGFREAHQSEKTDFPVRAVPYDDLAGDGTDVTS